MVTLTSADRIVSATAAQCLRLIAGAERQKGSPPPALISEEEKAKRYPVYEQLGDARALILGMLLNAFLTLDEECIDQDPRSSG